jgi:hypothetical protein
MLLILHLIKLYRVHTIISVTWVGSELVIKLYAYAHRNPTTEYLISTQP